MISVAVNTASVPYRIEIGGMPSADSLRPFTTGRKCLVITDSNLAPLYLYNVKCLLEKAGAAAVHTISFESGESSKNLSIVESFCRTAAEYRLNRKSLIIALGGGVTGDMAGFAAAIYMRGINFIQMPTSLLAMVDSSVGGKTGVDIPEGKNMIGAFHQPLAVYENTDFLETLPEQEFRNGMAEIIKMAATLDAVFFEEIEQHAENIHDESFLQRMISRSCELKADIVARDEKEGSVRAWLNFGHTFGHALESLSDFTLPHGEGVAIGMKMAVRFGEQLGLTPSADADRVCALTDRICSPRQLSFEPETVFNAMTADKKALDGGIRFVMMPGLGKAETMAPSAEKTLKFLKRFQQ